MTLLLWVAAWALTPQEWADLSEATAARIPDEDMMLDFEELAETATGEDKARYESARVLTVVLELAEDPWPESERRVFFDAVFLGSDARREQAVELAREGRFPADWMFLELWVELASLETVPRLKALKKLKERPLTPESAAKVDAAYAVAYEAKNAEPSFEALLGDLSDALGVEPVAPPIDEAFRDAVVGMEPGRRVRYTAAMASVASDADRARLESLAAVAVALEEADADTAEVTFLVKTALAADAELRSEAVSRAEALEQGAEVARKEEEEKRAAAKKKRKGPSSKTLGKYKRQKLVMTDGYAQPVSRRMIAGYDNRDFDRIAGSAYDVLQNSKELTAKDLHQELGSLKEGYLKPRSRRKRKAALSFVGAGAAFLVAGVGAGIFDYGWTVEDSQLMVGGGVIGLGATAGSAGLVLHGIAQIRAARYEGRFPAVLLPRDLAEQRIDAYNEDLREKLRITQADLKGREDAPVSTKVIKTASSKDYLPPEGKATVVFVRPGGYGYLYKPAIVDAEGTVLCRVPEKTHCIAWVDPGKHTFIAWGALTPSLKAEVEAGRIYYVEMRLRTNGINDIPILTGLGPGRPSWGSVGDWIADTRGYVRNPEGAEGFADDRKDDLADVLSKWPARRSGYNAKQLEARSLRVDDGVEEPRGR